MRHVSHSHSLPGNAVVSANGSGRATPASQLDSLRYGPRSFSAEAHDGGRTGAGLFLDLPATLLACIHLASPAATFSGRASLSRDVISLQAFQSLLALADQARPGEPRMEAAGGDDALAACALP